jgi:hypothetical protein
MLLTLPPRSQRRTSCQLMWWCRICSGASPSSSRRIAVPDPAFDGPAGPADARLEDMVTSRRTMLGLLDPAADPAGHAHAAIATVTDLEQLAER